MFLGVAHEGLETFRAAIGESGHAPQYIYIYVYILRQTEKLIYSK